MEDNYTGGILMFLFGRPNVEKMKEKRDIKGLVKVLTSDSYRRWDAAEALVEIGKPSVELLCTVLKTTNKHELENAAYVLGRIGDSRAVEPLCAALKASGSQVRLNAAIALGKIGDARAVDLLCAALKDTESQVRLAAADALAKIGDSRAFNPLCTALQDQDIYVREAVVKALDKIGLPDSVINKVWYKIASKRLDELTSFGSDAVEPLCDSLTLFSYDTRSLVAAIDALGNLGDNRAVMPLCDILKDRDEWVRANAVKALGKIGDYRAVVPLCDILKDRDKWVRANAATALGKIGDNRAFAPLCTALKDNEYLVRTAAAEALDKIGIPTETNDYIWYLIAKENLDMIFSFGKDAVEPLCAALMHSCTLIRFEAAQLLIKLYKSDSIDDKCKTKILSFKNKITNTYIRHDTGTCDNHSDYIERPMFPD